MGLHVASTYHIDITMKTFLVKTIAAEKVSTIQLS